MLSEWQRFEIWRDVPCAEFGDSAWQDKNAVIRIGQLEAVVGFRLSGFAQRHGGWNSQFRHVAPAVALHRLLDRLAECGGRSGPAPVSSDGFRTRKGSPLPDRRFARGDWATLRCRVWCIAIPIRRCFW